MCIRDRFRLLYAGKITDSKGVFELVAAYRIVRQTHPDVTLDLVGREDQETLDRIKELSGDDPTIHLFDVESQAILADHMRCCDLFVFPSYYEGMGLIAIEALASGLHLVSNMLPGLREQLGRELVEDPAISWVELPVSYTHLDVYKRQGMGLIAIEALASGLHLVSNMLPGLREQLGRELVEDPAISWVELPPLKNLDEIVDSARHEYIESLAEAICLQIERLKTEGGTGDFPFDKIASCSWDCLVSKIISVIESVI